MRYYEQERDRIDLFREEYEFLSNFYPAKIMYGGINYCNAEAAYQAQKCEDSQERQKFSELYGNQAKELGRSVQTRVDWEKIKIKVMEEIIEAKFSQNPLLARRLLETGKKTLVEGNNHKDLFWGADLKTGEGENHLGKILMNLREKYRAEGLPKGEQWHPVKTFYSADKIMVTDEDITQLDVECIVNAANRTLLGGGGIDGAIHREAGPGLLEECRKLKGCEPGEAKITGGYRLKAKYVIHTVGPVYGKDKEDLLGKCYYACLELARKNEIHSLAFPAISTGKFCFPKQKASMIAVESIRRWAAEHADYRMKIVLSCIDQKIYGYVCEYLKRQT